MARRTMAQVAAAIARHTGGEVPHLEILDAIADADKEINTTWTWPWSHAEANILIQAPYQTGTVSATNGSSLVTLDAGTGTWDLNWVNKRIYLGQSNIDLLVKNFDFSGTYRANLYQPINFGGNVVSQPYSVYQDMYQLPDDCEYGSILLVCNPIYRYRLRYIGDYTLEWQSVFAKMFFSNFQTGFSDAGFDDYNQANLIKFAPAPGSTCEYRLVYRRRSPFLGNTPPSFGPGVPVLPVGAGFTSTKVMLPESWDRAVELYAEYLVRRNRPNPLPLWSECKQEAFQHIKAMRRKMSTTMTDLYSSYWQYPYFDQSSLYTSGLFIAPTAAGQ
jgi:hypothetical protein